MLCYVMLCYVMLCHEEKCSSKYSYREVRAKKMALNMFKAEYYYAGPGHHARPTKTNLDDFCINLQYFVH